MPREIKTPLRYVTDITSPPVRTGKRGRPRTVNVEPKAIPPPKKPIAEPPVVIVDDDDDDVEILETQKPSKRKKSDDDPDWGSGKKVCT